MTVGIYEIRNLENGKKYVGSSVHLEKRWEEHKWALRSGKHWNYRIQYDWKKFGESAFSFVVIQTLNHEPEILRKLEQSILDHGGYAYNIKKVVSTGIFGTPMCDETKDKISAKLLGVPRTKEAIEALKSGWARRLSKGLGGSRPKGEVRGPLSSKHKQAIINGMKASTNSQKGRPKSEVHRLAMKEAQRKRRAKESGTL